MISHFNLNLSWEVTARNLVVLISTLVELGVKVHIRGEIIDEKYSRLLIDNADLDIWTVMLIDKVQKRVRITKD